MIVSDSGYISTLSQTKSIENRLNIAVVGVNNLPVEKNSSDSVQISEAARSKMLQKTTGFVDTTGEDGMYKLGLIALGKSTMQEWSTKGMNVSDEAVIAAGKAFQNAVKKMTEESGSSLAGSSLVLNKHQIIIGSQEVPGWFVQEYEDALSSLENKEMKSAFEKSELFFTLSPLS